MHVAANFSPIAPATAPVLAPTARRSRREELVNRLPLARLRGIIGRSKRHGFWILLWSLVGWIGTAAAPMLADKPFVLMLLSPRALFVALATESVSLGPFVLLGTARLSVTDASYYIIGRRVGTELATDEPAMRGHQASDARGPLRIVRTVTSRLDRLCRWACARPRFAAAFLFVRPNGKYLGLAGAYGVHPWLAGLSATLGTAVFLSAMHLGVTAIF